MLTKKQNDSERTQWAEYSKKFKISILSSKKCPNRVIINKKLTK